MITILDTPTHKIMTAAPKPKTFAQQQTDAIARVHEHFQGIIDAARSKYSNYEMETFSAQETEWRAYSLDNTAPTPIIDRLALVGGIDRVVLLGKIGANVMAIFDVLGTQQKMERMVQNADSVEYVEAVISGL